VTGVHRNDPSTVHNPPVRIINYHTAIQEKGSPCEGVFREGCSVVLDTIIPSLKAPLILVHGLCGFDRLYAFRRPVVDYFPGVREQLQSTGNRVFSARVSPTGGIPSRAADLKRFIHEAVPTGPVHIIGHSLGGMDARYAITKLGMERRVLSLTTIGTPHRGSSFADWGVSRIGRLLFPILRALGLPLQAFYDLMTENCLRFNEEVSNVPGVRYYSVAGCCESPWLGPEWRFPWKIVNRAEGPNDGVVSVASASWGESTDVWPGDHLNLVNWPNRRAQRLGVWSERAPDYGRIVRKLAAVEN
jgi:triacylglycerol lipase